MRFCGRPAQRAQNWSAVLSTTTYPESGSMASRKPCFRYRRATQERPARKSGPILLILPRTLIAATRRLRPSYTAKMSGDAAYAKGPNGPRTRNLLIPIQAPYPKNTRPPPSLWRRSRSYGRSCSLSVAVHAPSQPNTKQNSNWGTGI